MLTISPYEERASRFLPATFQRCPGRNAHELSRRSARHPSIRRSTVRATTTLAPPFPSWSIKLPPPLRLISSSASDFYRHSLPSNRLNDGTRSGLIFSIFQHGSTSLLPPFEHPEPLNWMPWPGKKHGQSAARRQIGCARERSMFADPLGELICAHRSRMLRSIPTNSCRRLRRALGASAAPY